MINKSQISRNNKKNNKLKKKNKVKNPNKIIKIQLIKIKIPIHKVRIKTFKLTYKTHKSRQNNDSIFIYFLIFKITSLLSFILTKTDI